MISFNKIITDYIKVDDTAVKNAIIHLYVDSDIESLPDFIHYLLENCGLHSINVMLVDGKKWDAYMSFSDKNIFFEKNGILEIIKKQKCKIHAEKNLAYKLIHLLDNVDFQAFMQRVQPTLAN
jgi:alkyl sulfatase BDS1-like metallo-beta-lactamase superfamily hydrolase